MYWRRRIVALAVAMGVLSLIAWAFTGVLGSGADTGSPGGLPGTGHLARPGKGGQSGNAQSLPGGGLHRAPARTRPCSRADVVLSMLSSQATYPAGQFPQFTVNVVNTARPSCAFNVGSRHIVVVVRSAARKLWNSADCVQGSGSFVADLQHGVPTELPISWNRERSRPGCAAGGRALPDGSYTAVAADGALASNVVTFRLAG